MGQSKLIQVPADEDGCIYIYNTMSKTWQKLVDVKAPDIPASVREAVSEMQRSMTK